MSKPNTDSAPEPLQTTSNRAFAVMRRGWAWHRCADVLGLPLFFICMALVSGTLHADPQQAAAVLSVQDARTYLQRGDELAARHDKTSAVRAYVAALDLARKDGDATDQLAIIQRLAWVDALQVAIAGLRHLLTADPYNLKARTLLARYLSWTGALQAAEVEADKVLIQAPEDTEALLVKADSLRWRGDAPGALSVYRRMPTTVERFDVRYGYTHALLQTGQYRQAQLSRARLVADSDTQRSDLAELDTLFRRELGEQVRIGGEHYWDTSKNRKYETEIAFELPRRDSRLTATLRKVHALDETRRAELRELQLGGVAAVTETIQVFGAAGLTRIHEPHETNLGVGHAGVSARLSNLTGKLKVWRELYDDTAQIIANQVVIAGGSGQVGYQMTDRVNLAVNYEYKDYSDDNQSSHLKLDGWYAVGLQPLKLRIGYRHESVYFDRQSGSGYFDPSKLHTNQLRLMFAKAGVGYDASIELYYGKQSFERFGRSQADVVGGWYASLRYYPAKNMAAEFLWEGGDSALQAADGFKYQLITARAQFFF